MADDSLEIQKDELPFHPCLTPRGMTWYDLNVLTPLQQKLLNELKIQVVRENNHYLARHPEIRAIIALFLRAILKEQPKLKTIADFARDFFSRPQDALQEEIDKYLKERGEPLKKEGDSAVNVEIESPSERSTIDDLTSLYHQGYYTYVSYTDEPSSVEEVEDWGTDEDIERLYKRPRSTDQTYTSTTGLTDSEYERRKFELLFASRASMFSGESVEDIDASTIDMTKDYMDYFGGISQSSDALIKDRKSEDEENKVAHEEIETAGEIEAGLSVILEHVEGEEEGYQEAEEGYQEEVEEYDEDEELKEVIEKSLSDMDLESLKEKSIFEDENVFDEEIGPRPSQKSIVLETVMEFEGAEGEG